MTSSSSVIARCVFSLVLFTGLLALPGVVYAQAMAAGNEHTLVAVPGGALYVWGANSSGQLGDGTSTARRAPTLISALTDVAGVGAGSTHSIALKSDGTVWTWGANWYGQLGHGDTTSRSTPTKVASLSDVVGVVGGNDFSMVLKADGTVWTWGANGSGQLGDGTTIARTTPVQVTGVSGAIGIAAKGTHGIALLDDGTLKSWGLNGNGQLGDGTTVNRSTPVAVSALSGIVEVIAGISHSLARKDDGTVYSWGANGNGQIGDGTYTQRTTPVALASPGTVTWLTAGGYSSHVILVDGSVKGWGHNGQGQIGDASTTTRPSPVAVSSLASIAVLEAGQYHSVAATTTGEVWVWGYNNSGQLGDGTTTSRSTPVQIAEAGFAWKVSTPALSAASGSFWNPFNVTVTAATPGATIHYRTDGTDPTTADSTIASGATLNVSETQTLKARAFKTGMPSSAIAAATYTFTAQQPGFSPSPTTYTTPKSVSLSSASSGTTIHYTTDGSTPTTSSLVYSTPVYVATSTLIRAIAVRSGWTSSPVSNGQFTMNFGTLTAPGVTPAAGTYTSEAVVTMTAQSGAFIRYTTNGTAVSASSPLYSGPFAVTATSTVNARAYHPDFTTSAQTSAAYTIVVATPVVNPTAGTVAAGTYIAVTTATTGATLRYTLNGSAPTATSAVVPANGIVAGNFTLKVGAWKSGATPSAISTSSYEVTGALTTPKIAAGATHTLAVRADGAFWSWGDNGWGQLGDGSMTQRTLPVIVNGISGATHSGSGDYHSFAIRSDGSLLAWGSNQYGQLGLGSTVQQSLPLQVTSMSGVAAVVGGNAHSIARLANGSVWAWGQNNEGQVGDGTTTQRTSPVQLTSLSNITDISAGYRSSAAVDTIGTVWTWGSNTNGQLGLGDTVSRISPTQVTALGPVDAMAWGSYHVLALMADGTVKAWGSNMSGQLGDNSLTQRTSPVAVTGLVDVTAVSAGASHSLALDENGTVWAWGSNAVGQVGDGTGVNRSTPVVVQGLPPIVAIAAGDTHSVALAADGAVWAWGKNTNGQLGDGTTTNRLAPVPIATAGMSWKVPTPVLSVASGLYTAAQTVTVTSTDPESALHYTVNGASPGLSDPIVTSGGTINVGTSLTLKVRGWKPGSVSSEVATATYVLKVLATTFTPDAGPYGSTQSVAIASATPGANITYTVDGTEPDVSSPAYSSGVSVATTTTVKARAFKAGWTASDSAVASYMIAGYAPATPTIAPAGGAYTAPVLVTIASTTTGATLRYTLDGTDPDAQSPPYLFPFLVDGDTTIKARAFFTGSAGSAVAAATYDLHGANQTVRPLIAPAGGAFGVQQVAQVSGPVGATLRYTTDGSAPTTSSPVVPSGGVPILNTLMLKVRAWGGALDASEIASAHFVIAGAIAAGAQHTLALDYTGKVWGWGRGTEGQLGDGTTQNSIAPVVAINAGVVAIAGGQFHSLAATVDGVLAWGRNQYGQLGDNTITTRSSPVAVQFPSAPHEFAGVAAGDSHSVAWTKDGTLFGWGDNQFGQLGGSVASHKVAILQGVSGISSAAAGEGFTVAVQRNGAGGGWLWAWGKNSIGQLGDGSVLNRSVPVRIAGIDNAVQVVAGKDFGAVLLVDGTVKAWGDNAYGQLGTVSGGTSLTPLTVPFLSRIVSLTAGTTHVVAIDEMGRAWAWGQDLHGQLGVVDDPATAGIGGPILMPGIDAAIQAAAGWQHTIVLRADGTLKSVGSLTATGIGASSYVPAQTLAFSVAANTALLADTDGDGLAEWLERRLGLDPAKVDSNGNGLNDLADFLRRSATSDPDDDRDGVPNFIEVARGTDPFLADSDGDAVNDLADAFPLDPARHETLAQNPNDTTPPTINLARPTGARPVGGGGLD